MREESEQQGRTGECGRCSFMYFKSFCNQEWELRVSQKSCRWVLRRNLSKVALCTCLQISIMYRIRKNWQSCLTPLSSWKRQIWRKISSGCIMRNKGWKVGWVKAMENIKTKFNEFTLCWLWKRMRIYWRDPRRNTNRRLGQQNSG